MKRNQDRLENFDEEIDAALKMLSNVQPPAKMTLRIHQKLEGAGSTSERTHHHRWPWIPAAGVAVVTILVGLFLQVHWKQRKQLVSRTKYIAATHLARLPSVSQEPRSLSGELSSKPTISKVRRGSHRRRYAGYRHTVNMLNYPLTEQEKMLVQFTQTAKPEDLQTLTPEYQAKVEAQQKAEFDAYLDSGNNRETAELN